MIDYSIVSQTGVYSNMTEEVAKRIFAKMKRAKEKAVLVQMSWNKGMTSAKEEIIDSFPKGDR